MEDHELVSKFESLGHGCEFGVFQRFCGAEPLGLFRFMAASLKNIQAVISAELDFFTAGDLAFRQSDLDPEYVGYSRRYDDFDYHTFATRDEISEQAIIAKELRKIQYLRSSFASVLANNEKIMVRTGSAPRDGMERLADLLRHKGTQWLLWVDAADESHAPGTVEIVKDGLLKGYLGHFAQFHDEPRIDVQMWLRICKTAYNLVQEQDDQTRPVYATSEKIDLTSACRLAVYAELNYPDPLVKSPACSSCFYLSHAGAMHERLFTSRIEQRFSPKTMLVFSVWILLPDDFTGCHLDAHIDGVKQLHRLKADLSKRDVWQQIWSAGRTPKLPGDIALSVRIGASAGAKLYAAGWRLETGTIPSEEWSDPGEEHGLVPAYRGQKELRRRIRLLVIPALRRQRRFARADRAVERGLSLFPHDIGLYLEYARTATARRDWPLAIARWTLALRAALGLAECHLELAAALRKGNRLERATAIIAVALRLFPSYRSIHMEAASIADARGRHAEAARHRRAAPADLSRKARSAGPECPAAKRDDSRLALGPGA